MICWLLAWSDLRHRSEYEALHDCGARFVRALLGKHDKDLISEVRKIEIHQQNRSIDVLARINGKHVLLVEDKTDTKDRDGQLRKYYEEVVKGGTEIGEVAEGHLYPVYLKTGNQPLTDDHRIEAIKNYEVFNRADFLNVLNGYAGRNSILVDFRRYLQEWEDRTNSYAEWTRDGEQKPLESWEGLYRRLEDELDTSTGRWSEWNGWGSVNNRAGGFFGFWWSPSDNEELYLQIEGGPGKKARLCFKVEAGEDSDRQEHLKWHWNERVLAAGGQQVVKPDVMGKGNSMTVAWWKDAWMAFGKNDKLDMPGTVENLKQAETVLKTAISQSV